MTTTSALRRQPRSRHAGRHYLAQTQWRGGGKRYFIDKQPPNWAVAGIIHAALPGAKIIHLERDPMGQCSAGMSVQSSAESASPRADPFAQGVWSRAQCHAATDQDPLRGLGWNRWSITWSIHSGRYGTA